MPPAKELPKGAAADEATAPQKKKSKFKFIMLLCSLLLLFAGLGGGGYWWLYLRPGAEGFSGLFGGSDKTEQAAQAEGTAAPADAKVDGTADAKAEKGAAGEKAGAGAGSGPRPAIKPVPLPSLTVNLADANGSRYLKIGMQVEVNSPTAVQEIEAQTARIRDAVILLLSSKSVADLASAEGKILLKNEVASRLNQILGAQRVVRIYFTDFVIQ